MRYPACTFSLGSVVRACWDGWARLETAGWAMEMAWLGFGVEGGREGRYRGHFSSITECKDAGAARMQRKRRSAWGYLCLQRRVYGGRCTCYVCMYVCMRAIGTDSTSSLKTPACGGECLAVCTVPLLLLLLLLNYCELKTYLCYDTSVLD